MMFEEQNVSLDDNVIYVEPFHFNPGIISLYDF